MGIYTEQQPRRNSILPRNQEEDTDDMYRRVAKNRLASGGYGGQSMSRVPRPNIQFDNGARSGGRTDIPMAAPVRVLGNYARQKTPVQQTQPTNPMLTQPMAQPQPTQPVMNYRMQPVQNMVPQLQNPMIYPHSASTNPYMIIADNNLPQIDTLKRLYQGQELM